MKEEFSARKLAVLFIIYLVALVSGTGIYVLSFWLPIAVKYDLLFFRSAILLVLACAITFGLLVALKTRSTVIRSILTYRDIFLICTFLMSGNWFLYGTVPFNVSRSNSMLILGYLYNPGAHPRTKEEITQFVRKRYFEDYDAVGIRLREQIFTGNVEERGGGYVITAKGKDTAEKLMKLSDLYNIKDNFLKECITNPND